MALSEHCEKSFVVLIAGFVLKGQISFEPRHEKTCLLGFPTRSDTNRAVQPQKIAMRLKFWI